MTRGHAWECGGSVGKVNVGGIGAGALRMHTICRLKEKYMTATWKGSKEDDVHGTEMKMLREQTEIVEVSTENWIGTKNCFRQGGGC